MMSSGHTDLFDNSYARLPESFFARQAPLPVKQPQLLQVNQALAKQLGFDTGQWSSTDAAAIFAGNTLLVGTEPLAMAYAGHQFGQFSPQLGDGRALLLGEIPVADMRFSIQLKGSGRTPFSRGGDGRSALGPVLREYLLSEAMSALGVPTTRALAAVLTGERVRRDRLLPGAILTRVARSYVRVGSFEYFSAKGDQQAVKTLADYVIQSVYPDIKQAKNPYQTLLETIITRQAALLAQWMSLGFIHGVMNTDNMAVSGETIDYGPCAFMDYYRAAQVYSSIDHQGRYAYHNQPRLAHWNLCRLAEALLFLLDEDQDKALQKAQDAINSYPTQYDSYWLTAMAKKLGIGEATEQDRPLIEDLLALMEKEQADFTLTFRYLSLHAEDSQPPDKTVWQAASYHFFHKTEASLSWLHRYLERRGHNKPSAKADYRADTQAVNPCYIPRNHQVEAVIRAAEDHQDFQPFQQLLQILQTPYTEQPGKISFMLPPEPEEVVQQTFCGT